MLRKQTQNNENDKEVHMETVGVIFRGRISHLHHVEHYVDDLFLFNIRQH